MDAAGLMPFGFHGILENTNIDDDITPGLYFPTDSCTNAPPAGWWGTPLLVFKTEGYNYFTQVYICSAQSSIYERHLAYKEQNWSAWTKT